jgi:hypothetical protein
MSKFSKPKSTSAVTQADIDRVIEGADAVDDRPAVRKTEEVLPPRPDADDVRFTMTLPADMAQQVDVARKSAGRLTRLSWIRLAVAEKLARGGV